MTGEEDAPVGDQVLNYLKVYGKSSIYSIVSGIGHQREYIKNKLYVMKRHGFVDDELVNVEQPGGYKILVHYFWLTPEGLKRQAFARKT